MSLDPAADGPAYPVRSVGKALEILLLLRDQTSISVSQASRELGIAPSTVHRLLSMLQHYGFARRDEKRRTYGHGPSLVSLGLAAVVNLDIRRRAHPHMIALAKELQETVSLIIVEGSDARFIDSVESPRTIRVGARTGLLRPVHCTSAGKAILAELPHDRVMELYPEEALPTVTPHSIGSRTELLSVLTEVRAAGYATNLGESDAEVRGVGVAIPELSGPPAAGLAVAAPAARMTATTAEQMAPAVKQTARDIASTFE